MKSMLLYCRLTAAHDVPCLRSETQLLFRKLAEDCQDKQLDASTAGKII